MPGRRVLPRYFGVLSRPDAELTLKTAVQEQHAAVFIIRKSVRGEEFALSYCGCKTTDHVRRRPGAPARGVRRAARDARR